MDLEKLTDKELLELYEQVSIEKSNHDMFQYNIKILMNSLYGSLANKFSRFYETRNAEAITKTGQITISWIEKKLNELLSNITGVEDDYVVGMDTDSCMLNFGTVVDKYKEKHGEMSEEATIDFLLTLCDDIISKYLDKSFIELKEVLGMYKHKLHMKREAIAPTGFYATKKRYALRVAVNEETRYAEHYIKVTGLQSVRSSTPEYFISKFKKAYEIILRHDNNTLLKYISEIKKEFKSLDPYEIAFNSSVNNIEDYYIPNQKLVSASFRKGTPINVRAAICYNFLIDSYGLGNKYEKIKSGDKVKYIYLKMPNTLKQNVIAFIKEIPPEFELAEHVYYNMQFKKAFIKPLQDVLDCFGWTTKKIRKLTDR